MTVVYEENPLDGRSRLGNESLYCCNVESERRATDDTAGVVRGIASEVKKSVGEGEK